MNHLVSVVMPSFNVGAYIADAIESVRRQTYSNFELIVVDDGSEDSTLQIIEQYSLRDKRISLIRQDHLGPGAARNVALKLAKGEFLSFVDADDIIEPRFLERMVQSLVDNNNDLAVCNVWRLRNGRYYEAELFQKAKLVASNSTSIRQHAALIWDTVVWNKVYRLNFYLEKIGFFSENILYEDMHPASLAHVRAKSISMIEDRLYVWRVRSEQNSITQNKADVANFRDRIFVSQQIVDLYSSEAPELVDMVFEKILLNDLLMYIPLIPNSSDLFKEVAIVELSKFLRQVPKLLFNKLDAGIRLIYQLLMNGRVNDLKQALLDNGSPRTRYPLKVVDSRYYAVLPFFDGWNSLSKDVFDVTDTIKLRTSILDVEIDQFGILIYGYAYIENLQINSERSLDIDIALMRGKKFIPLRVDHCTANFSRLANATEHAGYEKSGFKARIDFVDILQLKNISGDWLIGVNVRVGKIERNGIVSTEIPETTITALRSVELGDVWFKLIARSDGLVLNISPGLIFLHLIDVDECDLFILNLLLKNIEISKIELRLPGGESVARLNLSCSRIGCAQASIESKCFDSIMDSYGATPLDIVVTDQSGKEHRIKSSPKIKLPLRTTNVGNVIQFCESPYGNVFIRMKQSIVRIDDFSLHDSGWLHLSGYASFGNLSDWYIALLHDESGLEYKFSSVCVLDQIKSSIDVFSVLRALDVRGPLPLGDFTVIFNVAGRKSPVELGDGLSESKFFVAKNLKICCQPKQNARGGFVNLNVASRLPDDARGPVAQAKLRDEVYAPARLKSSIPIFLCDSFSGKQIDCNPLGLWEAARKQGLDHNFVFATTNGSVIVPPGVKTVAKWTKEYWNLLAQSKYVVTNDWMPAAFKRRKGQYVVQTWHGTPLKRIGLDIDAPSFDPDLHTKVRAESEKWDYLISQNSFSTDRFRKAFNFTGPILETGYPRNDPLFSDKKLTIGSKIRKMIGAKEDSLIILYAPTWRDDQRIGVGAFMLRQMLDLELILRSMPNVYFLARWHHLTVPEVRYTGNPRVIDVSSYPFTSHLFLAADILISDYSSIAVDFSLTRKPVLFFTPDLESYADRLRGFYIDYQSDIPGPILRKSVDVIDALNNIDSISRQYEDKYSSWVAKFGHLDDGHAGNRLLNMLLSLN